MQARRRLNPHIVWKKGGGGESQQPHSEREANPRRFGVSLQQIFPRFNLLPQVYGPDENAIGQKMALG